MSMLKRRGWKSSRNSIPTTAAQTERNDRGRFFGSIPASLLPRRLQRFSSSVGARRRRVVSIRIHGRLRTAEMQKCGILSFLLRKNRCSPILWPGLSLEGERDRTRDLWHKEFKYGLTLPCTCLETKSLNRSKPMTGPWLRRRPTGLDWKSKALERVPLFLRSSKELLYTALRRGFFWALDF